MSMHTEEAAVRIGPITVMTLLIVLALATLSVLSLTTARAAQIAVTKQDDSIQALYQNERAAQRFLAELDNALAQQRAAGATPEQAARSLASQPFAEGSTAEGAILSRVFDDTSRQLSVKVEIRSDMTYQIASWTTLSNIDTNEQMTLWQGNGAPQSNEDPEE